jgi:hypothetical protein
MRRRNAASRERRKQSQICTNEGLLLVSPPTFDLLFGRGSILQPVKVLMEHQLDRPAAGRIAAESTG